MYSRACTLIFTRNIRIQKKRSVTGVKSKTDEHFEFSDATLKRHEVASQGDPFANIYLKSTHAQTEQRFLNSQLPKEKKFRKKFIKPPPVGMDNYGLQFPLLDPTTVENQFSRLQQCVTPLSELPYEKQLKLKFKYAKSIITKITSTVQKERIGYLYGKNSMPLREIEPSPELFGYRNKDEFSVHTGVDGNPKTVGYFIGSPKDSTMVCVPPTYLINIKDSHKLVAKHFQKFIESSPYDTCIDFNLGGIWRTVTIRSNVKGELMVIVTIFPHEMTDSKKEEIKNSLKTYFYEGEGAECNLTSLYLQLSKHTRTSHDVSPYELIKGQSHIVEECLGAKFSISPESFFQVNVGAAESLYRCIQDIAEMSSLTTLMDICCGIGPVSIISSKHIRGSIGIDSSSEAISDAEKNAFDNNITNCTFHKARVEKLLPVLGPSLNQCSDLVAVVNPSRGGLHPAVVQSLRECESINKIIYVTCKPEGIAMRNFYQLMTTSTKFKQWSSKAKGKMMESYPFTPRYVVPVDMFPHTKQIEMIILFERVDSGEEMDGLVM